MKYSKSIIPFLALSVVCIILLLHFANITRKVEKDNSNLKDKIIYVQDQININEIEYSIFISYDYLSKLQKIYFENDEIENFDNRISFNDLKKNNLNNFFTVGMK
jgi:hypothetical protein